MFGLGMPELMVVLVIVMVLFGGKRLPELATGMGKAVRNFRKASAESAESAEIDVTPQKSIAENETPGGEKGGTKA
jgi:sec-independent protein translocase protein TatA